MNKESLEYKISTIFIYAISVDQDVTEKELNALSKDLTDVFTKFSITVPDIELFIGDIFEEFSTIEDEQILEIVTSAIAGLKESLPVEKLKIIYEDLLDTAGADVISQDEFDVLKSIKDVWNL